MHRKIVFITLVLLGIWSGAKAADVGVFAGDPYTLAVCPVSGEALGTMGEPVVQHHDGREIRFCCSGCPPKFAVDLNMYLSKLDALMTVDQKPFYPLSTDLVTGEVLPSEEQIVDVVYLNRLVRLGTQESAAIFAKTPDTYIAKLNEAVIAHQKDSYPATKCVVSGRSLDSMGEPVQRVYANRLVRLCCDNCLPEFEADPLKYFKLLENGE